MMLYHDPFVPCRKRCIVPSQYDGPACSSKRAGTPRRIETHSACHVVTSSPHRMAAEHRIGPSFWGLLYRGGCLGLHSRINRSRSYNKADPTQTSPWQNSLRPHCFRCIKDTMYLYKVRMAFRMRLWPEFPLQSL